MLTEVRDANNNTMQFQYIKNNGQVYPFRINYTSAGNSSSTAPFVVDFDKEARTDTVVSYESGFLVQTFSRINEINIKFNGNTVNKYVLGYTTGHNQVKSLLSSVTQTGYNESGTPTALPALTFAYQSMNASWPSSAPSPFYLPNLVDNNGKHLGWRTYKYQ